MSDDPAAARIAALEAEVAHLRTLLENSPDFITRTDLDGHFLFVNRFTGAWPPDEVLRSTVFDFVPESAREPLAVAMSEAARTRRTQTLRSVGLSAPGRTAHFLTRIAPIVTGDRVTSLVVIATDVTELEQNRTMLEVALDSSSLGLWTWCPRDGVGTWDATTRAVFGERDDQVPTLEHIVTRLHPEDRGPVTRALEAAAETGRYGPLQHRVVRPDGSVRWVVGNGVAVLDLEGRVDRVVGTVQDVTDRRALEARLREAETLESIGRLAGGVAHDFNNMLTAILGNVDLARRASGADLLDHLEGIRVTAERSAALTSQLLAFARRQRIEPEVLDPNALVSRLDPLLARVAGTRIRRTVLLRATRAVRVGASQFDQVLLNLVTNAREAMADGGVLTLRTDDVDLEGDPELPPGQYVSVRVGDTGVGIPAEHLSRVFEPFFTTREQGTGLGLATAYGIAKQSGGSLRVRSEPGRGATFELLLPRTVESPREAEGVPEEPMVVPGARVLVAEDEPHVRSVLAEALAAGGFLVTATGSGEEALAACAGRPPFELLVTDVVMPGISGPELATRLREGWPDLRVLCVSGYAGGAMALPPGAHFLQKPFSVGALLAAVRRALADGGS